VGRTNGRRNRPMDSVERGARAICARLRAAGHTALFAGGCVRDRLLGVEAKDYDIATSARPAEVAALFPRTVDVGAAFGVTLVLVEQGAFEVTTFRRDGPYLDGRHPSGVEFTDAREDALRRDFTINALFYDPEREAVLDFVDGQRDIERGVIRTVGNPETRFAEDRLRLLRAVRFAARLDYSIEDATSHAIQQLARQVTTTSAERIRDELVKMLTEGRPKRAFELMDATGLLREVLPEIAAMKGVEQPAAYHPEGDVFVHTLIAIDQLEQPTPTLAMGTLLHDVGKPRTQTFEDRIRFNEHDRVGAEMARAIGKRLRFSKHEIDRIVWLVAQHMRLATIPDMRESKRKRFVREDGFEELIALCRADCLASHGDLSIIAWIESYRDSLEPEAVRPPPLLTGRDLIAMGYSPGPRFKEILTAVEDAQLEGDLRTPEDARAYVTETWPLDAPAEPG